MLYLLRGSPKPSPRHIKHFLIETNGATLKFLIQKHVANGGGKIEDRKSWCFSHPQGLRSLSCIWALVGTSVGTLVGAFVSALAGTGRHIHASGVGPCSGALCHGEESVCHQTVQYADSKPEWKQKGRGRTEICSTTYHGKTENYELESG